MEETKEKTNKKKRKRRKKNYLLRLFLLICFCTASFFFLSSSLFDIQDITVENNAYYTSEQIIGLAGAKTGGNIFSESTGEMKKRLLTDPYIKNATVSRSLPSDIKIIVEERREAAYLAYRSDFIIIDNDGIVLRKASVEPKLTILSGLTIKKIDPGKPLEAEENAILTATLTLLKKMDEQELFFKKIMISNVVIKAYIYDNLICEGTPENLSANMAQLNEIIYDLFKKGIKRGVIKMGSDGYFAFSPLPE